MQGFWTKVFKIHFLFYLGSLVILIYLIFSLNNSLDKLNHLSSIKTNLESKNEKLSGDISKLQGEIEYIKKNPSYYLKIGREEYFYTKPDEFLYILISKNRVDTQTLQEQKRNTDGKSGGIKK